MNISKIAQQVTTTIQNSAKKIDVNSLNESVKKSMQGIKLKVATSDTYAKMNESFDKIKETGNTKIKAFFEKLNK